MRRLVTTVVALGLLAVACGDAELPELDAAPAGEPTASGPPADEAGGDTTGSADRGGDVAAGEPRRAEEIVAGAGVLDESVLEPSDTIRVTRPGTVIENLDVTGSIIVAADDVTIRNVRVRGSTPSALIRPERGITGTTIEHCEVEVTGSATGAIGYLGYDTTVRHCHIHGTESDGIKVESGGLYEYNHIAMTKAPGSPAHLDGIQGSGDTRYTIRHNVIDVPAATGGNAAVFIQAWNGAKNSPISHITVTANHLNGGNYTVFVSGGKDRDGTDPASWLSAITVTHNTFGDDHRYGHLRIANCTATTITANTTLTGTPVTGGC